VCSKARASSIRSYLLNDMGMIHGRAPGASSPSRSPALARETRRSFVSAMVDDINLGVALNGDGGTNCVLRRASAEGRERQRNKSAGEKAVQHLATILSASGARRAAAESKTSQNASARACHSCRIASRFKSGIGTVGGCGISSPAQCGVGFIWPAAARR